jgi:hypothetical protein
MLPNDTRLEQKITLRYERVLVSELLHHLSETTHIAIRANTSDGAGTQEIIVAVQDISVRELLDGIASLMSHKNAEWQWKYEKQNGDFIYTLLQPTNAQKYPQWCIDRIEKDFVKTALEEIDKADIRSENPNNRVAAAIKELIPKRDHQIYLINNSSFSFPIGVDKSPHAQKDNTITLYDVSEKREKSDPKNKYKNFVAHGASITPKQKHAYFICSEHYKKNKSNVPVQTNSSFEDLSSRPSSEIYHYMEIERDRFFYSMALTPSIQISINTSYYIGNKSGGSVRGWGSSVASLLDKNFTLKWHDILQKEWMLPNDKLNYLQEKQNMTNSSITQLETEHIFVNLLAIHSEQEYRLSSYTGDRENLQTMLGHHKDIHHKWNGSLLLLRKSAWFRQRAPFNPADASWETVQKITAQFIQRAERKTAPECFLTLEDYLMASHTLSESQLREISKRPRLYSLNRLAEVKGFFMFL